MNEHMSLPSEALEGCESGAPFTPSPAHVTVSTHAASHQPQGAGVPIDRSGRPRGQSGDANICAPLGAPGGG